MRRVLVLLTLVSMAWVVACGGGTPHSASNLTTGETGTEAALSPTSTAEVLTVAPTATVEAVLTQEEIGQIATKVVNLITTGLSETPVTQADLSKHHLAFSYGNAAIVSASAQVCVTTNFGDSFVDPDTGRKVTQADVDYYAMLASNCDTPGMSF